MAGRGFLKSHLPQAPKSDEGEPKPDELPKSLDASNNVPTKRTAVVNPEAIISGRIHSVRGRRAMLAHLAVAGQDPESKITGLNQNIISTFSNLDLEKPALLPSTKLPEKKKDIVSRTHTAVIAPQPELVQEKDIPLLKEKENSPLLCKVLKKSDKDSYQMTTLSSNYIKVELEENKGIYEYKVDFDPLIDVKSARFFLLNQHRKELSVRTFDGALLYMPTMLPRKETTLVSTLDDGSEVKITITFKRKNSLRECIHFYNVFLRTIMKILGLIEFGRSCYDKDKRILIPEFKLEIWPGYITTIDEFEDGLYMCAEVSHRILRCETVLEIMVDMGRQASGSNKDTKLEIMAALCGSTVITHYNHKTYRIDDIDFTATPLSTFDQNGKQISFVDYYKKMYNIEIQNLGQPMLITKAKKRDISNKNSKDSDVCCLVPEICNLTGLTEIMKSDFKLMKALQMHTLVTPQVRQRAIIDFVNSINDNELASKKFKDWGLIVRPEPVKLKGPVYKRENIILGNGMRKQVGVNMDWGIDVAKSAMFIAVNLSNWAILFNPKDEPTAQAFCKQLAICGRPLGMNINPPKPVKIYGTNPEVFVSSINNTIKCNPELELMVIIFPNQREDRYNAVKRICCSELGIPSQVIISRTLSRPDRLISITQKIALQINCKLGGACWAVDIPMKNTMIVGIDVYHEKGKQLSSVVGIVASMDKTYTEWCSMAAMQKSTHQELLNSIQDAFHKAADLFKSKNGVLPDKIVIYRDGVSDGDLKHVEEIELEDLENSFKIYPGNYKPMITCIIVQKRINTRVFKYCESKYSNPSSGTVIDSTITRKNFFDFFLVSQHVRQGTVNPTHYIVLKNGCNLSCENIQRLSYKLTHLYYNWCGTVKVPAPVQYAHKLAYLIGQNVRQMPDEKLTNTLFFL
ncbi:Ribonuclease H-like domain,Piwi domain,PAZ domain [Cinara cedri]|uniref:Ribonuclease H-like domain,Piwi domain,PAZ domain n=1 Tax=Cinara cedri TaxID=506608 RepID=A0A5E4MHH7_9HEMI|nr:Ribonuclease H-like domain,Piwi domain,PAZ domain [Cinara cedri]